ncbi:MAG: hypothetical protein Kapaf2KO_23700 [Candidatus Kapaibacteriales bacterium]
MSKEREIVACAIDSMTYEDIKGNEDLAYLYEIGGIEAVKNHFRYGFKNTYLLSLPPFQRYSQLVFKYIQDNEVTGLNMKRLGLELGYENRSFAKVVRDKRKKRLEQKKRENQSELFTS